MKYKKVIEGKFIARPNRFIAHVEVNAEVETVHVKNTGRCRELLIPGYTVYLSESDNDERKIRYDLIAVKKERENMMPLMINIDSQAVNDAVEEWLYKGILFSENAVIKREVKYGSSRFDFYIEDSGKRVFLEVKGVTLELNGTAMFPDAPTERGIKHLNELISCIDDGYDAYVLFVIQMKGINRFRPNDAMHKAFGDTLRNAVKAGVKVMAIDCIIAEDSLTLDSMVMVEL